MTFEQINAIVHAKKISNTLFEIRFKTREPIKGVFIETPDYSELSRKNLWRIVSESRVSEYKKSQDENLARIFNGVEFTKLQPVS